MRIVDEFKAFIARGNVVDLEALRPQEPELAESEDVTESEGVTESDEVTEPVEVIETVETETADKV